MLLLDLSKIRTPHERFDLEYAPETFAADRETFVVVAPVRLGFDVQKDGALFHLTGRVLTRLELPCSRCLDAFSMPVDAPFDLRYQPRASSTQDGEREVEEDDFSAAFYDDETIDLGQLMREQFYLAMPMKPLCAESCRGLCSHCGMNLNRAACECAQAWEDPRFAALRALRGDSHTEH